MGKVFRVVDIALWVPLLMPVTDFTSHLRVEDALCINIVSTLVNIDDDVEQGINACTVGEHGWNHRNTQQRSQFVAIDMVTSPTCLVEHIQSAHHLEVHVDELSGEKQVAFQI